METIKCKIFETILSRFRENASKYIISVQNDLCLITSSDNTATEYTDLIAYRYEQVTQTSITTFREAMEEWYV